MWWNGGWVGGDICCVVFWNEFIEDLIRILVSNEREREWKRERKIREKNKEREIEKNRERNVRENFKFVIKIVVVGSCW